jgi:hypothetical protein
MRLAAPRGDIVTGAFLLTLAAVIAQQSTTWPLPADVAGDPRMLPRILAAIMAAAGLLLAFGRRPRPTREEGGEIRPRQALLGVAVTMVFAALLEPLGVIVAGAFYLAAMQRLVGAPWRLVVPFALAVPIGIWLVFVTALHVPLPRGSLWDGFLGP